MRDVRWKGDSSVFTVHYNQRGHLVLRVIEVAAESGRARAIVEEARDTHIAYADKFYSKFIGEDELVWMSERDGWNHLYLYDVAGGEVKQQLTSGEFIVVLNDPMVTVWPSRRHWDTGYKNLGDAGFPDRMAWIRAAAEEYPYMDLDRVGIYGTSAGGQASLRGMLAHPDFYKVGVSSCGCHDNRMDKIWWNEYWMGWPVGPHYEQQSNVTQANKLEGELLLIVGEVDTNVDPASTMQVADALIEADKDFDLLVLPGQGHTSGGRYGERRRREFFVRHLLGVEPRWEPPTTRPAETAARAE